MIRTSGPRAIQSAWPSWVALCCYDLGTTIGIAVPIVGYLTLRTRYGPLGLPTISKLLLEPSARELMQWLGVLAMIAMATARCVHAMQGGSRTPAFKLHLAGIFAAVSCGVSLNSPACVGK